MSTETPVTEAPYFEAAHWFVRIRQRPLSASEWASFGNWFNISKWNRLAFEQVARVWQGAPASAGQKRPESAGAPARFSWHHADAWRDAVLPSALHWYLPSGDASGAGQRQYPPVRAAAAPAGLL